MRHKNYLQKYVNVNKEKKFFEPPVRFVCNSITKRGSIN